MGCWNETCMVSNLPISADQEVICVVLSPDADEDYNGSFVVEQSIASGIIDDYGSLEIITDKFCAPGDEENSFDIDEYHSQSRPVLFVLKDVWDKVVKFAEENYKESVDFAIKHSMNLDYSKQLVSLFELVDQLRELTNAPVDTLASAEYKKLKERENQPIPKLYREWIAVRCFLRNVRKCYVNTNAYTGCQHLELHAHKFLNTVVSEQIVTQEKQFTYE